MTSLTGITLVIILYGALSPHGYGRSLALAGSMAAGAALVAGGIAVPTFYAVALGTAVALGFDLLPHGRRREPRRWRPPPGVSLLLLFAAWSIAVTMFSPVLFDGTPVIVVGGARGHLTAGSVTSSNVAQMIYLVCGVCVVIFLARSRTAGPELIGLAAGLTIILSLWRYAHQVAGVPFPEGFFDNSPGFAYIETAPGGLQRFRGIFSEPAGLAGASLVAVSYMSSRSFHVRGWRRAGALTVAVAALYLGIISTSATFVVASVVMALIVSGAFLVGFLARRRFVSAVVGVVSCTAVVVALFVLPVVTRFVETTVNQKVASSSFTERSGSNGLSYGIFLDTWGMGVGLGGTRASSFLAGLLSTTGLVGVLLFSAFVIFLLRRASLVVAYRPVLWALVATLVLKTIAGPDLSDSSGVFWMSFGLLSRAVLLANGQDEEEGGRLLEERRCRPERVGGVLRGLG